MKQRYIPLIVTHDGGFHADDVIAYAILNEIFPDNVLVRTRKEEYFGRADILVDVGMTCDADKNRFDHHMRDNPKRPNGDPYSSAGLIWRKWGMDYIALDPFVEDAHRKDIWQALDDHIFLKIDRLDNGLNADDPPPIHDFVICQCPTWIEEQSCGDINQLYTKRYMAAVHMAGQYLRRSVRHSCANTVANTVVKKAFESSTDKSVIELELLMPSIKTILENNYPVEFIIYEDAGRWMVATVPDKPDSFSRRRYFPSEWGGITSEELRKISGVSDAVFVHRNLFIGAAESIEGARKMVEIALRG